MLQCAGRGGGRALSTSAPGGKEAEGLGGYDYSRVAGGRENIGPPCRVSGTEQARRFGGARGQDFAVKYMPTPSDPTRNVHIAPP